MQKPKQAYIFCFLSIFIAVWLFPLILWGSWGCDQSYGHSPSISQLAKSYAIAEGKITKIETITSEKHEYNDPVAHLKVIKWWKSPLSWNPQSNYKEYLVFLTNTKGIEASKLQERYNYLFFLEKNPLPDAYPNIEMISKNTCYQSTYRILLGGFSEFWLKFRLWLALL